MAGLMNKKKHSNRTWRPDFRNVESLPDTKTIRTSFLLNFIAVALVVAVGSAYIIREYSYQNLKREVKSLEVQVSNNMNKNRSILDTNKRFEESAAVVAEAVAFDWQPVKFYDLVEDFTDVMQEGMVLTNVQLSNIQDQVGKKKRNVLLLELKGKVLENAPVTPAQLLKNYQDALRKMPCLNGAEIDIEMAQFSRNNMMGNFDFTLDVKIPITSAPSL